MPQSSGKPFINVTPLIDVLLVVLIIFMIAAPLKPHSFAAKLPAKPDRDIEILAGIHTLKGTGAEPVGLQLDNLN